MKYRGIGALLLALPLSAVGASLSLREPERASANSAPPYWEGTDGTGAILAGDQCPVEVEEEHLRFSLTDFPTAEHMESAEKFASYRGSFTAEYTFRNPTESDVGLGLVFPLGPTPTYFPYTEEAIDRTGLGYAVTQDGRSVDFTVRHTYEPCDYQFDLTASLGRLYPGERKFYRDDLPATVYRYRVTVPPRGSEPFEYVTLALSFDASGERTRVFCSDNCNYRVENGAAKLTLNFDCMEKSPLDFSLYVLGESISEPRTAVLRYERGGAAVDSNAQVALLEKESTRFLPLALSFREEGSAVSDSDWRNALIDMIEENREEGSCYSYSSPSHLPSMLMPWFAYSLTVPAGESVQNSVSAPIYPTIDGSTRQPLYRYTYLLSPAQKWASFGKLTVDIDTPYFLTESSLTFEKREGGYTLTRESLPLGELTFTLSREERPIAADNNWTYGDIGDAALTTAIVLLCVMAGGAAILVTVLVVLSRHRKKKREEEERRLLQTRPQEGRIDLPDDKDES